MPELVGLMREFHAEAGFVLAEAPAALAFEKLIAAPDLGMVWMARMDGVPAGYVALVIRFSLDLGGMEGIVEDLYVRPGFRRRGLAAAALEALIAECRCRGIAHLRVEVGAANTAARSLYGRFGLTPWTDDRLVLGGPVAPSAGGARMCEDRRTTT